MPTAGTYADLAATGRGRLVYYAEIHGVGVFATDDYEPTAESWYTDAHYGRGSEDRFYPWLEFDVDPIKEEIDFLEARLKVNRIKLNIVDVAGGFTALLKSWRSWTHTWLTSTVSALNDTLPVVSVTGFPTTSSYGYIGGEAFFYSTVSTGTPTFEGVDRGEFGTDDAGHFVDLSSFPPSQPTVTAGPHTIVGRRVTVHCAVIDPDTGTIGATTVVYRGRITKGIRTGRGVWEIPVEHISEGLKVKIGDFPQAALYPRRYYYSGETQSISTIHIYITDNADPPDNESDRIIIGVSEGHYNVGKLYRELISSFVTGGVEANILLSRSGTKWNITLNGGANAIGYPLLAHLRITEGDPLWALGFEAGTYESDLGTGVEYTADNEPRLLVCDFNQSGTPQISIRGTANFEEGEWVQIANGPVARIPSGGIGSAGLTTLDGADIDRSRNNYVVVTDDEDDLIVKHVITMGYPYKWEDVGLREALQRMLNLESGQTTPDHWLQSFLTNDDFDWTELDNILASMPTEVKYWTVVINEEVEVWKHIGQAFGVLGICPRLTSTGTIGFTKMTTPLASLATSVSVDSAMWALLESAEAGSRLDDSPILNTVAVKHTKDYHKDGDYGPTLKYYWREGLENMFASRRITYECPGWVVSEKNNELQSLDEIQVILNGLVRATHFGVWGRESATIAIPCGFTSRQLYCGDYVNVTHPVVPNTVDGSIGVTNRLGLVIGRKLQMTPNSAGDVDMLLIRIGPEVNSGGIAPCARATAWNQGSTTLTFTGADGPLYAQSGTDLDIFSTHATSTIAVKFYEYDVSTVPSTWTGTISTGGVDSGALTAVLTSDVFGAGFPATGVYMTLPNWDDADTWQAAYAYIADLNPTLGSSNDAPMEWTI